MKPTTSNRRKVLVPLATLLAAGAIAVGSGASFTATTSNSLNSVTAGNLRLSNGTSGAIFTATNFKPGQSTSGTVTLSNTGSLDELVSLTETSVSDSFQPGHITVNVSEGGAPLFNGTLESMLNKKISLQGSTGAAWKKDETHTYTFTVTLDANAGNEDQDKTVQAAFQWDGVQS